MELHKHIENLLEKYFEATTTVAEEQELIRYFAQDNVAPHLEQYRPMFQYFSMAKEESPSKHLELISPQNTRRKMYRWAAVVSGAVIMMGFYLTQLQKPTLQEEYSTEELASVQQALALFADNFNKGAQQINYLDEFDKSTSKFLIDNN